MLSGSQTEGAVHQGNSMAAGGGGNGHTASMVRKQRDLVQGSASFLLLQSRTTAHSTVLPIFRAGCSFSVKPFWKHPYRHTQRFS